MSVREAMVPICLIWLSLVAAPVTTAALPQSDYGITKEELAPLLGRPDLVVVDVRFGRDWHDAKLKIKGAVHEDPLKPGQWKDKYPKEKMIVFYCD